MKLRSFALALAVSLAGSQALGYAGLVKLGDSMYLANPFSWLLLPLGGLLFGWGMVLANGCGARTLVLLGQGNLRSFVVLLCLGITAYMTLTGVIAPLRAAVLEATTVRLASGSFGAPDLRLAIAGVAAIGLAAYAFASDRLQRSRSDIAGGIIVGLLVVAGWLATGRLGQDEFEPTAPSSLSFVAPIGASIQYLMIATGVKPGFDILLVAGVLLGSLAAAVARGRFHLEGFQSPRDMLRYMAGGALMGVGGALAMGCSIGQGLSGLSTLAWSSMIAAVAIVAGNGLALRKIRAAHRTGPTGS